MNSKRASAVLRRRSFVLLLLGSLTALGASLPARIVSLSPNTTEILYGVGAFGRVVAVSRYCSFPPEVAKLPRVGGWQDASIESIVAQRPDLVVLTKAQEPFIGEKLRQFGIHSLAVPAQSVADVFTAIGQIGAATGHEQQATDLARKTRASLEEIRSVTKALPSKSVLLVVSRSPGTLSDLYVATQGSYLVDLLQLAGGKSITTAAPSGYATMSKEAVLTSNPDVIIDMVHRSESQLSEKTEDVWNDLPELKAVKEKHVYAVDDEFVPHPSQFMAHTVRLFASILHPEAFPKGGH